MVVRVWYTVRKISVLGFISRYRRVDLSGDDNLSCNHFELSRDYQLFCRYGGILETRMSCCVVIKRGGGEVAVAWWPISRPHNSALCKKKSQKRTSSVVCDNKFTSSSWISCRNNFLGCKFHNYSIVDGQATKAARLKCIKAC
jgi:hypothetical protein